MPEPSNTPNLDIPRILGSDLVSRGLVNRAIDKIDAETLPKAHEGSKAHFDLWKPNTAYRKQDVVRTPACPNWGFYMCVAAGTSGAAEPAGFGEGDIIADGTVTWILKLFGGSDVNSGATQWNSNRQYYKNSLAVYRRLLYRSKMQHISGTAFNPAQWELLSIGYIPEWAANTIYETNTVVTVGDILYRCATAHTSLTFSSELANWEILARRNANLEDWKANEPYKTGDAAIHESKLYRCAAPHTSGSAFSPANWELLDISYLPDWQSGASYSKDMAVKHGGVIYRCILPHTAGQFSADRANWEIIVPGGARIEDWQANAEYIKGEAALHGGFLYRAKQAHNSGGSFSAAQWERINAAAIDDWQSGAAYEPDRVVAYNQILYRCAAAHTASQFATDRSYWTPITQSGIVIDDWQVGRDYAVGEIAFYQRLAYRCKSAHTSQSAFTPGDWEETGAGFIPDWKTNTYYAPGMSVTSSGKLLRCKTGHTSGILANEAANWETLSEGGKIKEWKAGENYNAGDCALFNNQIYQCKTQHTSADFANETANWQKIGGGTRVENWRANTMYEAGDYAFYRRLIYRCKAAHTSGTAFAPGNWELLNLSCLPDWTPGETYEPNMAAIRGNCVLRCVNSHTSAVFADEKNNWEIIAASRARVPNWEPAFAYETTDAVLHNGKLYVCLSGHTSGATFQAEMSPYRLWEPVRGYREEGRLRQVTETDVAAPKTLRLPIRPTASFMLPQPEALKFAPEEPARTVTAYDFGAAGADDFTVNGADAGQAECFDFGAALKPNIDYDVTVNDPVEFGGGTLCETEYIQFAHYKEVLTIRGGF